MNENDRRHLLEESLSEAGGSSGIHSTQLLTDEIRVLPAGVEYEIPNRYHINMLVCLPVNLETSFVYWEVTSEFLAHYHTATGQLKTKVFSLHETKEFELEEFSVSTELGRYYLHIKAAMQQIQARMGFYDENGDFMVILVSNIFCTSNAHIEFSENEVWMNVDENTREIIRASVHKESENLSSMGLYEEKNMEFFTLCSLSSGDLIKRGQ
ncbi:MAG: DUF4912 domain-containing protein [Sulfuricurvum sp.]|nr:DUF4912 domain-containing protein [Sulfuricurvum sp.]MDD5387472.1 DUF4912 domain-containing protein [Sulfuricurvum sp.]